MRAEELNALLGNCGKLQKGDHLESKGLGFELNG
jgi:hypothetical protein